jgi:hypothetical protein
MAKPRQGKAKVKVTASGKKVSYGQAGQAKEECAKLAARFKKHKEQLQREFDSISVRS